MSILRKGSATLISLACLLAPVATPASATPGGSYMSSSGSVRECVWTNLQGCDSHHRISKGTSVQMVCWILGSTETGEYDSDKWFYIKAGSLRGYVHSSRVKDQTSEPKCTTMDGITASAWASERVWLRRPTVSEQAALNMADRWWSGYCATFVYGAYLLGADETPRYGGDAGEMYNSYHNAGLVRSMSQTPNIGSLVFWPEASDLGHVAVYVGNGSVASTDGYEPSEHKKNLRVTMSYFGTAAGWVDHSDV